MKPSCDEVAAYFVEVFKRYSVEPIPMDRLLPNYRVANDDLTRRFPDLTLHDIHSSEMQVAIRKAMRRARLSFKR